MQTRISEHFRQHQGVAEAEAILRSCVHCGFCTATCPTYQLLGDELDGPRGRIYLIKQALEGQQAGSLTLKHLDRCLGCRSCETTCPSGVRYGRLLDIARELVAAGVRRPLWQLWIRWLLRRIVPWPARIGTLLTIGYRLRRLLPSSLREKLPARVVPGVIPDGTGLRRQMLVLEGCVQSVATPRTNAAARRILARLDINLHSASGAGCCGALSHHLGAGDEALDFARRNIDAWWPMVERGVEAIVATASGCGLMLREYGDLFRNDPDYADKARRVSELVRDVSEVLAREDLAGLRPDSEVTTVAFHSPCTLQHGQQLDGVVESILERAGFELLPVKDAHLCCGSAGTYSLLQPALSTRLRDNKLDQLERGQPDVIATANIGCQLHLGGGTEVPVKHWLELLDPADSPIQS